MCNCHQAINIIGPLLPIKQSIIIPGSAPRAYTSFNRYINIEYINKWSIIINFDWNFVALHTPHFGDLHNNNKMSRIRE